MSSAPSLLCVGVALALSALGDASRVPDPLDGAQAFEAMRTLVGTWDAKTASGQTFQRSYRLVASDSVLVETFTTKSGRETLTVFHLDGPRLIATHYCAQRNQPRLQLAAGSTERRLIFDFMDATSLKEGASHLRRLELELVDAGHFRTTETYAGAGKDEVTVSECVRREP